MAKTVFLSINADVIHSGHIRIIQRAAELGDVIVGVLSDEAENEFNDYPSVSYEDRASIVRSIKGVVEVIPVSTMDCREELLSLRPDIVVHGDNWKSGVFAPVRRKVIETLSMYGGRLVEFPYSHNSCLDEIENASRRELAMPERRRPRLKQLLGMRRPVRVMEAHNGLTGLIVESTQVEGPDGIRQFDAMWISSLTDSTARGKPDTELVDTTSRINTIEQIMEVTTKPIILDGDSGGLIEHFQFFVSTLERIGVSAVIIEDKVGLKRNSLFGASGGQGQDTIEHFCAKIRAGKNSVRTPDFMIIARIESLILEKGVDDALDRARAYVAAGADGIMIHSKSKTPDEVYEFCDRFRSEDSSTPLVVVPTSYNTETEEQLGSHGANIVIYANHLIRAAFPAMEKVARTILRNGRSKEVDDLCMPIKEVITLIPASNQ